jgi:hypothetical protein
MAATNAKGAKNIPVKTLLRSFGAVIARGTFRRLVLQSFDPCLAGNRPVTKAFRASAGWIIGGNYCGTHKYLDAAGTTELDPAQVLKPKWVAPRTTEYFRLDA